MALKIRGSPSHASFALLAVFLAMMYGCEKAHESRRTGVNPEWIGRAMENTRLPDGDTGTITGSIAAATNAGAQGPFVVHVQGFRGTAVIAGAGENFILTNVPVGERRILIYQRTDGAAAGGATYGVRTESVTVATGQTTDAGALAPTTAGAIHGTVAGTDGAETYAYIPGTWFISLVARDGSYLLNGVPSGKYRITIARAGSLNAYSERIRVVDGVTVEAPPVSVTTPFAVNGAIALNQGAAFAPPTTNVDYSEDAAASMVIVSENASFKGASWRPIPETIEHTFAGSGAQTLYAKFRIGAIFSTAVSDGITIDASGPTGAIAMQNGMGFSDATEITLAVTADDIAGVEDMMISLDADFAGASWEPYAPARSFTLADSEGVQTIYLKLRDSCDNIGEVITGQVAYEPRPGVSPAVSVIQGAYTGTQAISLKAASSSAGGVPLAQALISESSDFTGATWQAYGDAMPFTISAGEGPKTIYVRFKDSAGNVLAPVSTQTSLHLSIPTTPVISNVPRRVTATSETIVIITPSTDSLFKSYVARGGAYTDWTEVSTPIVFSLPTDNTWYALEVRGKDLAGNMSDSAVVRLFRGNQTILDGSAVQQTGESSRSAASPVATLNTLYGPYLLRGSAETSDFEDYNLAIEAGVTVNVTPALSVTVNGLTVNGTATAHVTFTSANTNKAAGDWRFFTLDGALKIKYMDVAYYTYTMIASTATAVSVTGSSFHDFKSYGLRDYAEAGATYTNLNIRCPSTSVNAGYTVAVPTTALHAISGAEIQNCKVGMDIDLATTVTVTGSDISGNTTNIFIPSSATGTITFTGNTFGAALGSSLATYKIINDSTAATLKVQD